MKHSHEWTQTRTFTNHRGLVMVQDNCTVCGDRMIREKSLGAKLCYCSGCGEMTHQDVRDRYKCGGKERTKRQCRNCKHVNTFI